MPDILNSGAGTDTCGRCGKAKEVTRHKSRLCRTCDAELKGKRPASATPSTTESDELAQQLRDAGEVIANLIVRVEELETARKAHARAIRELRAKMRDH
jgi:hypothetical protein